MAITQDMTVSFKVACLNAEMDLSSGTSQVFMMALYTSLADLDYTTAAYTTSNEVADGGGYSAGGIALTISLNPTAGGKVAYIDFDNPIWASSVITARGSLIYTTEAGNPSVAVIDFGEDKTTSGGDFVVQIPPPDATNAILRYA